MPHSCTVTRGSGTTAEGAVSQKSLSGLQVRLEIPKVVRNDTARLALSHAFVGADTQLILALGVLVILQLTHLVNLTGLGTAMMAMSRFKVAYPAGKISDRFGRKSAIAIGLASGIAGALMIDLAVVRDSFPILVSGFLVFGLGMGMIQQVRVAAADMYPPGHRGQGTGYVLMGSLVGAIMAPSLIALAQRLSPTLGIDPLGLPWLFIPALIIPAMILLLASRPATDREESCQVLSRLSSFAKDCTGQLSHGKSENLVELLPDIICNSSRPGGSGKHEHDHVHYIFGFKGSRASPTGYLTLCLNSCCRHVWVHCAHRMARG